ncbi:hypothetical protein ACJMK2_019056 [Sinanodonta woodiana]|uniref:CCHC-type domain-containing protein n=1 Tax=Sinanodonta woodiana TaxID=1069815 RepID=A0ABD3UIV4_SINWO
MRKIKKQTGELHLSCIPMEITLEATVTWFEEKFGIKVESAKLGKALGFPVYNGTRILEIEKTKLHTMKKVFFLRGILTRSWYKGCICHRKCYRCGNTGHTPYKCPANEDAMANTVNNEQNDENVPKHQTGAQSITIGEIVQNTNLTKSKGNGKRHQNTTAIINTGGRVQQEPLTVASK